MTARTKDDLSKIEVLIEEYKKSQQEILSMVTIIRDQKYKIMELEQQIKFLKGMEK